MRFLLPVHQRRFSIVREICVAALMSVSLNGCGDGGLRKSEPTALDGVWESASSSVEIENTCGIEGGSKSFGGGIFPLEVKRRVTAVEVVDERGSHTRGYVVGSDGLSVEFSPGMWFSGESNFAWYQERVVFTDVQGAEANYVHIIEISGRSDGSPDCQIKLGGIAMRLGAVRPE